MIKELEKYFKETPIEKVLKDWEATKEFDNIPQKHCVAGKPYSDCEIHADNIDGCLGCGNFQILTD
jgi:hypothetical protein